MVVDLNQPHDNLNIVRCRRSTNKTAHLRMFQAITAMADYIWLQGNMPKFV